jgi:hypothetical protein
MPSDKQLQANRLNATHSTGPRTPEGKARAALNSVRHGLLARSCVLPEEDRKPFLALLAGLEAQHQPVGPEETYLVEQIACAQFRMARLLRIETGFLDTQSAHITKWDRREARLADRVERYADPASLPPRARFDAHTRILGRIFQKNAGGDAFSRLARYGASIQRTYFRSLKLLLELQLRRTPPSPPAKPNARREPISPCEAGRPEPPELHNEPLEPPRAAAPPHPAQHEPNSRPPAAPPPAPYDPFGAPPPVSEVLAPSKEGQRTPEGLVRPGPLAFDTRFGAS